MSRSLEKHSSFFNLKDAFKEPHCPICFLARKTVTRFFDTLLYEQVNDAGLRKTLRRSHGFCQKHYWQLVQFGDGLGIAILSQDLLPIPEAEWRQNPGKIEKEECPACTVWNVTVKNYLGLFIENLEDNSVVQDFQTSFGLCISHFRAAHGVIKKEDQQRALLEIEIGKMSTLSSELEEFIRKSDYRFSEEAFGKEKDSWIRIVEFLKGRSDLLREK